MTAIDELNWNEQGLLPAIVQDVETRQVLMMAWVDQEALQQTFLTGDVHFFSRSRNQLWRKGETSGNRMILAAAHYDCDGDTLLFQVAPLGPACHTGSISCFFNPLTFEDVLPEIVRGVGDRIVWSVEAAEGEDSTDG